jgi:hypothetical protein
VKTEEQKNVDNVELSLSVPKDTQEDLNQKSLASDKVIEADDEKQTKTNDKPPQGLIDIPLGELVTQRYLVNIFGLRHMTISRGITGKNKDIPQ